MFQNLYLCVCDCVCFVCAKRFRYISFSNSESWINLWRSFIRNSNRKPAVVSVWWKWKQHRVPFFVQWVNKNSEGESNFLLMFAVVESWNNNWLSLWFFLCRIWNSFLSKTTVVGSQVDSVAYFSDWMPSLLITSLDLIYIYEGLGFWLCRMVSTILTREMQW